VCDFWDHETEHLAPVARALAAGVISRDDVVELPDLVAGRHPGRATDEQRIFSSPVGLAIEDVAAAARVLPKGRGARDRHSAVSLGEPDLGLSGSQNSRLQFSQRKT